MKELRSKGKSKIIQFISDRFLSVVKLMLNNDKSIKRIKKLKNQYRGLPNDSLSEILIKRAVRKTTIEGAANGAAITGFETTMVTTAGSSTPAAAAAIGGLVGLDVTCTTTVQMQLIFDIVRLYECPFSKDNEEDVWLIFKGALGIRGTERIVSYSRVIFSKTAKRQFRKILRTGIRRTLQQQVRRIGGKQIAKYLAEKYVMRLIYGVNIIIGSYFNRRVTMSVGKWTKVRAKIRSSTFKQIDLLNDLPSTEKYLALPLIFAVGTVEDKLTDNLLWLYVQSQNRLQLTEEQTQLAEELANDEQLNDKMKSAFSAIQDKEVKAALLDIAVTTAAVNIKTTTQQEEYLNEIASWLGLKFKKKMLEIKVKYLKK